MKIKVAGNQLEAIEGITSAYPYVIHHVNLKEDIVPWHWHEEVEFIYVINGKMEVTTANKSYEFEKDEAFFMNTNILSTMQAQQEGQQSVIDSHLFHPVFLGGHFKSIFHTKYIDPVLQNKKIEIVEIRGKNERQLKILKKLWQVGCLQHKNDVEFQIRSLFSDIWMLLIEEIDELEANGLCVNLVKQERIQTMMSFVQRKYMEKISLLDIAQSAAVSKRECIRCFENCMGKSPFEYLLEYRIEMAEKLLVNTKDPIAEIAMQTGFSNSAYFGKVFKMKCGLSPGAFRKRDRSVDNTQIKY